MKLIVDSGSTKTDWCLVDKGETVVRYCGRGINPCQQESSVVESIIVHDTALFVPSPENIRQICFYGAGCRDDKVDVMTGIFRKSFPFASNIEVGSDLLAAARALFPEGEGIACRLGTGSNSCLYRGGSLMEYIPPLGYILGDEGSGAVLGRMFVNALFKNRLPVTVKEAFIRETGLSLPDIINKVYREPSANRFLAGMSVFIGRHIGEEPLRELVKENFTAFFINNINAYGRTDLPVGAIGSIAYHYSNLFSEVAEEQGYTVAKIMKSPMEGLLVQKEM